MTDQELDELESLERRVSSLDFTRCGLDSEDLRDLRELLDDVPWLLAEVRRLRHGPGLLGAMLRYKRIAQGLSLDELAHEATLRDRSTPISPEEVRALEEGTQPIGPRWPDVLRAIGEVLGLSAPEVEEGEHTAF